MATLLILAFQFLKTTSGSVVVSEVSTGTEATCSPETKETRPPLQTSNIRYLRSIAEYELHTTSSSPTPFLTPLKPLKPLYYLPPTMRFATLDPLLRRRARHRDRLHYILTSHQAAPVGYPGRTGTMRRIAKRFLAQQPVQGMPSREETEGMVDGYLWEFYGMTREGVERGERVVYVIEGGDEDREGGWQWEEGAGRGLDLGVVRELLEGIRMEREAKKEVATGA